MYRILGKSNESSYISKVIDYKKNVYQIYNDLFDIFNSKNQRQHGFKKPISNNNYLEISKKEGRRMHPIY